MYRKKFCLGKSGTGFFWHLGERNLSPICQVLEYTYDMTRKTKILQIGLLILPAVFLYILCSRFSYFADDWHWGMDGQLSTFIDSLSNPENTLHYHNNGRYFGNFLGFVAANHRLFRNVLMTVVLWGICVLTARLGLMAAFEKGNFFTPKQSMMTFLCGTVLLLTPKEIFRESIGWCSAFMNYVVPVSIYLCCFLRLFGHPDEEKKDWLLFLLPLLASFFMENLTVGNALFSVIWLCLRLVRKKKIYAQDWLFLAGSFLGLMLMFADDGYRQILTGNPEENYWGTQHGTMAEMLRHSVHAFAYFIAGGTVGKTAALTAFGAISCTAAFVVERKKLGTKRRVFLFFLSVMDFLIALYFILRRAVPEWNVLFDHTISLEAIFSLFFLLSLPLFGTFLPFTDGQRVKLVASWLFAACITAPLFVAEPLSMRVFFPTTVFLLLFYIQIASISLEKINRLFSASMERLLLPYVMGAFLLVWGYLFSIYAAIDHYEQERIKYVRYQESLGNYEIDFPALPYSDYVIVSYPWEDTWQERYKKFFDLNLDTRFSIVSFDEWKENL